MKEYPIKLSQSIEMNGEQLIEFFELSKEYSKRMATDNEMVATAVIVRIPQYALDDIKELAAKYDATYHDVIKSICLNALEEYSLNLAFHNLMEQVTKTPEVKSETQPPKVNTDPSLN